MFLIVLTLGTHICLANSMEMIVVFYIGSTGLNADKSYDVSLNLSLPTAFHSPHRTLNTHKWHIAEDSLDHCAI